MRPFVLTFVKDCHMRLQSQSFHNLRVHFLIIWVNQKFGCEALTLTLSLLPGPDRLNMQFASHLGSAGVFIFR